MDKIVYEWANDDKTMLLCTYTQSDWTWDDFHQAFKVQNGMLDNVNNSPVHIMVDVRKSQLMPKGGSLLSGMRKLSVQKHPRQGHTVIVGAKGVVAVMSNLLTRLLGEYRQELHMVDTMEEGYALLARIIQVENQKQQKTS